MKKKASSRHPLIPLTLALYTISFSLHADEGSPGATFSDKGLTLGYQDFQLTIGTLLQYDWVKPDEDKTVLPSDHDWRNTQVSFSGKYGNDWSFKYGYDFTSIGHKDAWLSYKPYYLIIGQFKSPVGLENQHSSRWWTFNESAMTTTLAPQRFVGVMWQPVLGDWTFAAALQKGNVNDEKGHQPLRTSTRLTWSPLHSDIETLHLGASLQWLSFNDKNRTVSFAALPEVKHRKMPKLISTGKLEAKEQQTGGLEAGYVFGPLSLRGEYLTHRVKESLDRKTLYFQSAYLQASYFLDGETSITYNRDKARFDKPSNVNQRWEVAARGSWADLDDRDIKGGIEKNYTLGINFYYNLNLRFTLNYTLAEVTGGINGDERPSLISFRTQLAF
ncbi:MAG: OprO/OprP family phosphate-selective porin [Endozoicomonas sp.]